MTTETATVTRIRAGVYNVECNGYRFFIMRDNSRRWGIEGLDDRTDDEVGAGTFEGTDFARSAAVLDANDLHGAGSLKAAVAAIEGMTYPEPAPADSIDIQEDYVDAQVAYEDDVDWDDVDAGSIETFGPYPYTGPARGAEENASAHGNVSYVDRDSHGRTRDRNVNGAHEETGAWM
jgi:hypothetical protein